MNQNITNYKTLITEEIPKYLKGKKKRKDRCRYNRYRCRNGTKENQYWREKEDQTYKICREEFVL